MKALSFNPGSTRRTVARLSSSSSWRKALANIAFLAVFPATACSQRPSTSFEKPSEKHGISEEAVHFVSGDVHLGGTLVLPGGPSPHPAVVLFHGSGPQQRDLFTARWFATQGVAALAYDKRGVGESDGNFLAVPFMQLSDDGLAAIGYLKSRNEIDAKRIGAWGLSQGGWLGPLAASRSSDVAYVIAVSGPGVSPGEQMIVYYANELRNQGLSEPEVREASAVRRDIWSYMESGRGYENVKDELDHARAKPWFSKAKAQQDDSFGKLPTPAELSKPVGRSLLWFKQEAVYDPVPALRALRVPALFLFGDKDELIPVEESVAVIRRVLAEDAHHNFTIRVFVNVDHQMRLTTNDGDGAIDPRYLEAMRDWLKAHVLRPSAQ
ncbi:MAG TPA: alpha/beta hydrolase [Candidatus Acidoferrum sp.]|nr:alpha/beta hydrolase [Candidatus Acidoferrum sp.]